MDLYLHITDDGVDSHLKSPRYSAVVDSYSVRLRSPTYASRCFNHPNDFHCSSISFKVSWTERNLMPKMRTAFSLEKYGAGGYSLLKCLSTLSKPGSTPSVFTVSAVTIQSQYSTTEVKPPPAESTLTTLSPGNEVYKRERQD